MRLWILFIYYYYYWILFKPCVLAAFLWHHSGKGQDCDIIAPWERIRFPTTPPLTSERGAPLHHRAGGVLAPTQVFLAGRSSVTASYVVPTDTALVVRRCATRLLVWFPLAQGWRWQVLILPSRNQSLGSLLLSFLLTPPSEGRGWGASLEPGKGGSSSLPVSLCWQGGVIVFSVMFGWKTAIVEKFSVPFLVLRLKGTGFCCHCCFVCSH